MTVEYLDYTNGDDQVTVSYTHLDVYKRQLDDIEMYFMAAIKEIKKGIGSHYAEQEAMSKKVAEKMFTELTKGQEDVYKRQVSYASSA